MILGRNAGLWAALIQAGLNVGAAAVVVATNTPLSPAEVGLFAALNAFGLALVGIVANESDPTTLGTFAAGTTAPGIGSGGTTAPSTGAPTSTTAPIAAAAIAPTEAPAAAETTTYPPA